MTIGLSNEVNAGYVVVGSLIFSSLLGLGVSNALIARFMHVGKPFFSITAVKAISATSALIISLPTLILFCDVSREEYEPSCSELLLGLASFFLGIYTLEHTIGVLRSDPLAPTNRIKVLVASSIFAAIFLGASLACIAYACHSIGTAIQEAKTELKTEGQLHSANQ